MTDATTESSDSPNPCLGCGACCAYFRASFYWAEANDATPGGVPVHMTEYFPPRWRIMLGTNQPDPYCIALAGEIGQSGRCSIHPVRSSTCREFDASYVDGKTHNPRCDAARQKWGLPPLTPEDWRSRQGAAI